MSVGREPIDVFGHKVRPLTVGQVERIESALFPVEGRKPTNVQLARDVVRAALSRDHAAIDVDDIECDVGELSAAMTAVLRLGGFVPPGEASAAAENAQGPSTGALSEVG